MFKELAIRENRKVKQLTFVLDIEPPRATAQEKQITWKNHKPIFYAPAKLKVAKKLIIDALNNYKPDKPFTTACKLTTIWVFSSKSKRKEFELKATKPDTDNLQKMLKDCLTKCGFWQDDALCAIEHCEKRWSNKCRGILIQLQELEP